MLEREPDFEVVAEARSLSEAREDVVDTVVARVLDHLGVPNKLAPRWAEEGE